MGKLYRETAKERIYQFKEFGADGRCFDITELLLKADYNYISKLEYKGVNMVEKHQEGFIFAFIISCFPFVFVTASFFSIVEPYNFLVFVSSLMEGSFIGSILGIVLLFFYRGTKSIKVYILSLLPVFMFLISMLLDSIYSYNKP